MEKPIYPKLPWALDKRRKVTKAMIRRMKSLRKQGWFKWQVAFEMEVSQWCVTWWTTYTQEQRVRYNRNARKPVIDQKKCTKHSNISHKRKQKVTPRAMKTWFRDYGRYLRARGLKV